MNEKNLTIREAASRLQVSDDTVRRMVKFGKRFIIQAGRQPRIPEDNLKKMAENYARKKGV